MSYRRGLQAFAVPMSPWWLLIPGALLFWMGKAAAQAQASTNDAEVKRIVQESKDIIAGKRAGYSQPV
jgi:hypothetical protein